MLEEHDDDSDRDGDSDGDVDDGGGRGSFGGKGRLLAEVDVDAGGAHRIKGFDAGGQLAFAGGLDALALLTGAGEGAGEPSRAPL